METTLGKRIAAHRKALGLTQDQLAEQLGITAQAISKWENDLSCPDITLLPKLADIFATTTDALLGRETAAAVIKTEGNTQTKNQEKGFTYDSDSGNLDFHWDGFKLEGIGLACWVLFTGIMYLLTRLLHIEVSFWNILWPSFLLIFGAFGLYPKFSVLRMGCALAGGYFLLDKLQILSVTLDSGILLAALVVLFGLAMLSESVRKQNTRKNGIFHSVHPRNEFHCEYSIEGNTFSYEAAFGNNEQIIELHALGGGHISTCFGDFTVDLTAIGTVEENCCLHTECSFGQLHIRIPRSFRVIPTSSTAFASLDIQGQPNEEPAGTIALDADVSFGSIIVSYI